KIILKPAVKGYGMVVGKTMRAYLESFGIKDIVGKCLNSTNPINVLNATQKALLQFKKGVEKDETSSD
ncbi:MAG: 30S ribosomal protein S5, partial [Candidatus Omnitrophica bacterium]|nr:30S ribosomal protein S5 [Candidatus Omnitrophota bacterium]